MLPTPTVFDLYIYRLSLDISSKTISINFTHTNTDAYLAKGDIFWLLDPNLADSLFYGFAFINPLLVETSSGEPTGQYIRFVHPKTLHPLNALYLQKIGIQLQLMTHSGNKNHRFSTHLDNAAGKRLLDEPITGNLVTFVDLYIKVNATVSNSAG